MAAAKLPECGPTLLATSKTMTTIIVIIVIVIVVVVVIFSVENVKRLADSGRQLLAVALRCIGVIKYFDGAIDLIL